ncbi:hypothetical protein [Streptomyces spirodelae]|uniref:hypothetical protein n=1 Tax=Streptomyces spirodelae TaxID=2812904 RepID=UPI001E3E77AB|nr:hypothetical protein [Streptomyces spirodelae]
MSEFAQGPGPGHAPTPEQQPSANGTERYDETAQPEKPYGRTEAAEKAGDTAPSAQTDATERAREAEAEPDREAEDAGGAQEQAGEPDDGPRPLGVPLRPTGHGPVDAHLRRLEDADHLAVSGHLEVYEDVHRGLRESLAALDRPHTPRS